MRGKKRGHEDPCKPKEKKLCFIVETGKILKDLYVRIKVSRLTFCRAHADKNVKDRMNEVETETKNPVRSLLQ